MTNSNNITYCGSKTKVSTNNAIVTKPVHTYQEGSPSRYKTIKDTIDEALPGSGCGRIRSTGKIQLQALALDDLLLLN
jgi:hypothetical protein